MADTFAQSKNEAKNTLIGQLARDLLAQSETPSKDLATFLAVENKRECVGATLLSPLVFPQKPATNMEEKKAPPQVFLFGPVAVHTNCQRQSIGQQLIVENVSPVLLIGPSALCALTVLLNAPQLPAAIHETHQF